MDAARFDGIAKALGSGADRRRMLSVLGGGLAAALGGGAGTLADHKPSHCAKAGQKVQSHKECCSGLMGVDSRCMAEPGHCQELLKQFRFCGEGQEDCCDSNLGLVCCSTIPNTDPNCRTLEDCLALSTNR